MLCGKETSSIAQKCIRGGGPESMNIERERFLNGPLSLKNKATQTCSERMSMASNFYKRFNPSSDAQVHKTLQFLHV